MADYERDKKESEKQKQKRLKRIERKIINNA
jgi:hypothetical protein